MQQQQQHQNDIGVQENVQQKNLVSAELEMSVTGSSTNDTSRNSERIPHLAPVQFNNFTAVSVQQGSFVVANNHHNSEDQQWEELVQDSEQQLEIQQPLRGESFSARRQQLQRQQRCCLCCCFTKEQFIQVTLFLCLFTYVFALYYTAFDANTHSTIKFCVNASRWTAALATLLAIAPLSYCACEKLVIRSGVERHTGLLSVQKRNIISIAESLIGRLALLSSFIICVWLTLYMIKLNQVVHDCSGMLYLFQFFLILYWFCFYLLLKAFIETSPEALIPDVYTLYAEM